ncbi:MAG: hypothetical protein N2257_04405 [Thermodesulfovibrionales bacterium]|nr:hypothetical protein [Thermodesulfovibrionales bacterium]
MVALALLAVVGATLMELFSQNLKSSRKTADYTAAMILAGSETEKALSGTVEPGSEKEFFDKYTLTREIRIIDEISEQLKLYEVLIRVSWNNNHYEIRTIKLYGEKETGEE